MADTTTSANTINSAFVDTIDVNSKETVLQEVEEKLQSVSTIPDEDGVYKTTVTLPGVMSIQFTCGKKEEPFTSEEIAEIERRLEEEGFIEEESHQDELVSEDITKLERQLEDSSKNEVHLFSNLSEKVLTELVENKPDEDVTTSTESSWKDIPEVGVLSQREGGEKLIEELTEKDYSAYTTCMYMYRQYMIDSFGRIGSKNTAKLMKDDTLLDGMAEGVAIKICVAAGILPQEDEDIRPYLRLYLEHIGYDADEDLLEEPPAEKVKESVLQKAERIWKQKGNPELNPENQETLETGECIKGLLEMLDDGDGHILPEHISKVAIILSQINEQDDDLFEVVQYIVGNNIEQPLPGHLQERAGVGTAEEIEEGRLIAESLTQNDPDSSLQSVGGGQCILC